jgi:hypothetical protein
VAALAWVGNFRTGCSEKGVSERISELTEREAAIFAFSFGFPGFSERGVRMKRRGKAENTKPRNTKRVRELGAIQLADEGAEPGGDGG